MLGNILLTDRSWYGILHYWASRLSERYKDFICETGHWMGIWNYQNWKELLMCEKLISFSTNDCLPPTWGKLFWQVDVILSMLFLLETLTSYIIIYLLNWLHWHQYHLRFLTRFIGPEKGYCFQAMSSFLEPLWGHNVYLIASFHHPHPTSKLDVDNLIEMGVFVTLPCLLWSPLPMLQSSSAHNKLPAAASSSSALFYVITRRKFPVRGNLPGGNKSVSHLCV